MSSSDFPTTRRRAVLPRPTTLSLFAANSILLPLWPTNRRRFSLKLGNVQRRTTLYIYTYIRHETRNRETIIRVFAGGGGKISLRLTFGNWSFEDDQRMGVTFTWQVIPARVHGGLALPNNETHTVRKRQWWVISRCNLSPERRGKKILGGIRG